MHPVVNHLLQLQDLILIRDEQQTTQRTEHLEKLDEAIRQLTDQLHSPFREECLRLYKRDHIVIAAIWEGKCTLCRMQLPVSLVQTVKSGREVLRCPNCARILYFLEGASRWIGQRSRPGDPPKLGIARFSAESLMVPRLQGETREAVIRELAYKMEAEGFVDRAEQLVEAALRREAIVSTGFGHGLAFPHARGVEGGGLTLALGISRKGVDFGAADGTLARMIFFLAIPTAASAFYLKLLAGLTETFSDGEARKTLLEEKEAGPLWKTLLRLTRRVVR